MKFYYEFAEDFIYMNRKFAVEGVTEAVLSGRELLIIGDCFTAKVESMIDAVAQYDGCRIYFTESDIGILNPQKGDSWLHRDGRPVYEPQRIPLSSLVAMGARLVEREGRPFIFPNVEGLAQGDGGVEQIETKPMPKPKRKGIIGRLKGDA